MNWIKQNWRRASTGLLLVTALGGSALLATNYLSGDCCGTGASCCKIGASCCHKSVH